MLLQQTSLPIQLNPEKDTFIRSSSMDKPSFFPIKQNFRLNRSGNGVEIRLISLSLPEVALTSTKLSTTDPESRMVVNTRFSQI